jgi:hypothetical protein
MAACEHCWEAYQFRLSLGDDVTYADVVAECERERDVTRKTKAEPMAITNDWPNLRQQSTAVLFPKFAKGFIVINVCDAARLANAIGARIWLRRSQADAARDRARGSLLAWAAKDIHVVPVDGPNEHFALPFVVADNVSVNSDGWIRKTK